LLGYGRKKESDNTTLAMPDEAEEASAARLIVAVLQFAGLGQRYKVEG
jgi:hypothetical protein